jgi:hypothetical protein
MQTIGSSAAACPRFTARRQANFQLRQLFDLALIVGDEIAIVTDKETGAAGHRLE